MTMTEMNALATYNSEKARGLVHTEEYVSRMEKLQAEYTDGMANNRAPNVWPPFFVKPG